MKQLPNNLFLPAIDLAAFLFLIEGGSKSVKSFEHKLIYDKNVAIGYHDVETGEYAFSTILRVN